MDKALQITFGQNLRAIRRKLGLTQMEMAERLDRNHTYLGGLERAERNPTLKTVQAIVDRLGLEPVDLLWDRARVVVALDSDGTPHLVKRTVDPEVPTPPAD